MICPVADYVEKLLKETNKRCNEGIVEEMSEEHTPAPLSSQYEKPVKVDAIKSHRSRFTLYDHNHSLLLLIHTILII